MYGIYTGSMKLILLVYGYTIYYTTILFYLQYLLTNYLIYFIFIQVMTEVPALMVV